MAVTRIEDEDLNLRRTALSGVAGELRDFWHVFDVHRLQIRLLLREALGTERLGLAVLDLIVPDPVSSPGADFGTLQRRAWLDREWTDLDAAVRERVDRLVEDGLIWPDWVRLLRPIRMVLINRICDGFASEPSRMRSALMGMTGAIDHLTAFIGEGLSQPDGSEQGAALAPDVVADRSTTAEETIRLAIDAAPVALIAVREDGTVAASNRQAEIMFGYARGELDDASIETLLPEEARARHVKLRNRFNAMPSARPMAAGQLLKVSRKDGSEIRIEVGLTPFVASEGKLVLASVFQVTQDRQASTQLRRTLAELERSNEELEQFAYVASHDLQEPLRMVASYTELLRRQYEGQLDESADIYIKYAVEGAQRLSRVVQDLLSYSRVGAKSGSFVPTDTDQLVENVLSDLSLALEERGAEVEVVGRLPTVVADPGQLGLVFQNLIGNAIKFARPDVPARVRIVAERTGEQWQFSITDNGLGIEPQYIDRIFGLFQRLHTREEYEGSGIGLTVTRRVVERHGGRIWAESVLGEGSTFCVRLPLWPVTTG